MTLPVLAMTPERLGVKRTPDGVIFTKTHVGIPVVFGEFCTWAERCTFIEPSGDADLDKVSAGGIVCGAFEGNRRKKAYFLETRLMSFDFDNHASVDRVVEVVADLSTFVHETFKSRPLAQRARLFVELAAPVTTAADFDQAHAVMRKHFAIVGLEPDEAAKDVSRLNYCPVCPHGAGYRCRRTHGAPLDLGRLLAVQPPPPPKSAPRLLPLPERRDRYVAAALESARAKVGAASEGGRHLTLCREAWSLARLGLAEHEIADALVGAFVHVSGEHRRREAERTVRDTVAARGAA